MTHSKHKDDRPALKTGRKLFFSGVLFFLFWKLFWVVLPVPYMGMPRLGDDSFVYLWKGQGSKVSASPAIGDIRDLSRLVQLKGSYSHDRVFMRTVAPQLSFFDLVVRFISSLGLDFKWSFAVVEILVVICLTCGLAYFLRALFGERTSGFALALLAVAFLPHQGLHYLIPAVLCLSLAFGLWGMLASNGSQIGIFLMACLTIGVHPIGLLFVCLAVLLAFVFGIDTGKSPIQALKAAIPLIGLVVIWSLLPFFFPDSLQTSTGFGTTVGLKAVRLNSGELGRILTSFARNNPFLLLATLGGGLFCWPHLDRKALFLTALIILLLLVSPLHYVPGVPGTLFAKIFVILVTLFAGIGGTLLSEWFTKGTAKWKFITALALVSGHLVYGLAMTKREMFKNIFMRPDVLSRTALEKELKTLPDNATILYLESDIALMASLLAGGASFGALPYQLITDSTARNEILKSRLPKYLATIPPRELNSLDFLRIRKFEKRRHGVPMRFFEQIQFSVEKTFEPIRIRIENPEKRTLVLKAKLDGKVSRDILVPALSNAWHEVGVVSAGLSIQFPKSAAWLTGIAVGEPRERISWPWSPHKRRLISQARPASSRSFVNIDFSIQSLFSAFGGQDVLPLYEELEVLSDQAGIVFLAAPR